MALRWNRGLNIYGGQWPTLSDRILKNWCFDEPGWFFGFPNDFLYPFNRFRRKETFAGTKGDAGGYIFDDDKAFLDLEGIGYFLFGKGFFRFNL